MSPAETSREPHTGHPVRQLVVIWLIASLILIAIGLLIDWFPKPASSKAGEIDTLYDVLLIVSIPVFVMVMTIALYAVWRWRARPGDMGDGPPIHGNTRLEIAWVSVPAALLIGLAVYAALVLRDVEAKKPNELRVHVIAQQFTFHFQYPQYGNAVADQLYLPKGRPVYFQLNTRDVIHSFWVPNFRLKSDIVPGITTHVRATPNKLGSYSVVCTQLCGAGHSVMRVPTNVVPPAAFNSWVAKQRGKTVGGLSGPSAAGSGSTIGAG